MEKLSKEEKKSLKELERLLGARFWDKNLLRQALIHKSYAHERRLDATTHYERLEFLGDAVLGLVVAHALMEHYPQSTEGELSKLRASMVNEKSLAALARQLGLGDKLYLSRGEESGKGRHKDSLLSDVYEAVLGALYLDRGFKKTWKVVRAHADILLGKLDQGPIYKDYKTRLQELSHVVFRQIPRYHLVDQSGPDHERSFRVAVKINDQVYGTGEGKSKKEAQQVAAKMALEQLEKQKKG